MTEKGYLNLEQAENMRECLSGKDFIEAVAKAPDKESLKLLLHNNGIAGFSDEMLEECWVQLALSQNLKAMEEIFAEKNFESCKAKLAAHGIETTQENFALINDILAMGQDPDYIRRLMKLPTTADILEALHKEGYTSVTEEFLELLTENAVSLAEDGILNPEELKGTEHGPLWKKYFKVINTLMAMVTVVELMYQIPGAMNPAFVIAIACGICLM